MSSNDHNLIQTESNSPLSSHSKGLNKPLMISGLIIVGLMGGLAGLFAATNSSPENPPHQSNNTARAHWLGSPQSDTESDSSSSHREDTAENSPDLRSPEHDTPLEEENLPFDESDGHTKQGKVQKGVPVIKSLTRLGLSGGDAQLIINALSGIFDFRRARPGHTFHVRFDSDRVHPILFRYEASPVEIYEVIKQGDKLEGKRLTVKTQKKTKVFAGTITRSLFGTLSDLGAHPSLAPKVVDVLATQVNFFKEQRPGDTFRVVVEEERLKGEFLKYGPVLALEYNGVKAGKKRLFRFQIPNQNPTYYDTQLVSVPRSVIAIPLHYTRMSSPFGYRMHPVLKRKKLHNGTDFAAPTGTPVWACAAGKITLSAYKGANGKLVGIDHGDGLQSYYAHLSKIANGIKPGTSVKQRQVIGYVGSTGRSTGPHLHWGLKHKNRFTDPLKYKIRPGKPIPGKHRNSLKKVVTQLARLMDNTPIHPPKEALAKVPDSDEMMGLDEDF